jgi:hypothetical protein
MRSFNFIACLLLATGFSIDTSAQTVTVQVAALIDSTKPAAQYNGTVKTAVSAGNVQIPAGAPATMKLVPVGNTNPPNWTLALTSVSVNGSNLAVSGGSPSIAGVGGISIPNSPVNVSQVQQALGGFLNHGKGNQTQTQQQKTQSSGKTLPSVSGPRVYVPAMTSVSFVVGNSNQQQMSQPVQQTAAVQQTSQPVQQAAGNPAPQQASQPVQQTAGVPAPQQTGQPLQQPAAAQYAQQPAGVASQSSNVVQYEGMQYELKGCKRESPHIVCDVMLTNQRGTDAKVVGGQGTHFFDQFGNKVGASSVKIANCNPFGWCEVLPGVPVSDHIEFVDADGRATQLVRLQVWLSNKAVAQYTNVAIQ